MGSTHKAYDYEAKLATVRDHVDGALQAGGDGQVRHRQRQLRGRLVEAVPRGRRRGAGAQAEGQAAGPRAGTGGGDAGAGARGAEQEAARRGRLPKKLHALMAGRRAAGRSPR